MKSEWTPSQVFLISSENYTRSMEVHAYCKTRETNSNIYVYIYLCIYKYITLESYAFIRYDHSNRHIFFQICTSMLAMRHTQLFKIKFIKIKTNLKFSSSVLLATFQVLSSHMGLCVGWQRYGTFPPLLKVLLGSTCGDLFYVCIVYNICTCINTSTHLLSLNRLFRSCFVQVLNRLIQT